MTAWIKFNDQRKKHLLTKTDNLAIITIISRRHYSEWTAVILLPREIYLMFYFLLRRKSKKKKKNRELKKMEFHVRRCILICVCRIRRRYIVIHATCWLERNSPIAALFVPSRNETAFEYLRSCKLNWANTSRRCIQELQIYRFFFKDSNCFLVNWE